MKAFNYKFEKVGGGINIQAVDGYMQALSEVYKHLAAVTEFNPEKRYVDALVILEKIAQTNAELMEIMKEYEKELRDSLPLTDDQVNLIIQQHLS